jgi:hypothetical protein
MDAQNLSLKKTFIIPHLPRKIIKRCFFRSENNFPLKKKISFYEHQLFSLQQFPIHAFAVLHFLVPQDETTLPFLFLFHSSPQFLMSITQQVTKRHTRLSCSLNNKQTNKQKKQSEDTSVMFAPFETSKLTSCPPNPRGDRSFPRTWCTCAQSHPLSAPTFEFRQYSRRPS